MRGLCIDYEVDSNGQWLGFVYLCMVPKAHTSILLSPFKRVSLKQRLLVLNAYPCTGQVKASGLHGTVVAFLGTVCL